MSDEVSYSMHMMHIEELATDKALCLDAGDGGHIILTFIRVKKKKKKLLHLISGAHC